MPPDLPRVNNFRATMFTTSPNDIAPQMENVMYGPDVMQAQPSLLDLQFAELEYKLHCQYGKQVAENFGHLSTMSWQQELLWVSMPQNLSAGRLYEKPYVKLHHTDINLSSLCANNL